ncbi:MAG: gliding motility-associated-like protein, partial [Vicingaceae bacterium]
CSTYPTTITNADSTEYFGVFMVGGDYYDVTVDYTNNTAINGQSNESLVRGIKRSGGEDATWERTGGEFRTDVSVNTISIPNQTGTEYVLGFTNTTYPDEPGSGYALDFDGVDDGVYIGSPGQFVYLQDLSVDFWFNANSLSNPRTFSIAALGETANTNVQAELSLTSTSVLYRHESGSGVNRDVNFTGLTIPTNSWHHMAMVRDGAAKSVSLYLDGVLLGTGNYTVDPEGGSSSFLTLGRSLASDATIHMFDGQLDEFRLWDKQLTQEEIRDWMTKKINSSHPQISNLVSYYRFDENTGTTLQDLAGGNDGILTNMNPGSDWVQSGAALGDSSGYTYGGTDLSINNGNGEELLANSFTGSPDGMHLYYVNDTANTTTAPPGLDFMNAVEYAGTFVVGGTSPTYSLKYTYATTILSAIEEREISFATRPSNAVLGWAQASLTNRTVDNAGNNVTQANNTGRSEFAFGVGANNALYFDGSNDNYIQALDAGFPAGNTPRTMEAWVKTNSTAFQSVMEYGNVTPNQRSALLVSTSGKLLFVGQNNDFTGSATVNDNKWHHVAVTFDSDSLRLYVDGQADGVNQMTLNTTLNFLRIGMRGNNLSEQFNGEIDEVKIWNRALCADELSFNRNCESPGNTDSLLVYYNFNQGSASQSNIGLDSLVDLSGNGNTGTLTNFALVGSTSNWVSGTDSIAGGCGAFTAPAITVGLTFNTITCNGLNDGWIKATVSGSNDYSIAWSNGSNLDSISSLSPGKYLVTVTGICGSTTVDSAIITQPTPVTASISSQTNVDCNGNTTGAATAAGSGGTAGYTYVWSNGGTTATASNLGAATYSVTVTDTKSCEATTSATVGTTTTIVKETLAATNTEVCSGSGTTITTNSSESGISYSLYDVANNLIDGPAAGTGSSLTLNTGNLSTTTDFYVEEVTSSSSSALDFDGTNDFVDIPLIDLSNGDKLTIEALIKPLTKASGSMAIVRQQTNLDEYYLEINSSLTSLSFMVRTVAGNSAKHTVSITATNITDGNWHHVAGVYNGTDLRIYVDGAEIGAPTAKIGNFVHNASGSNNIGAFFNGFTEHFNGGIDEVRIWNIARTQAEISTYSSNFLMGSELGLFSYYDFENGTGTTLSDQTSNGNNGTLTNMDPNTDWISRIVATGNSCVVNSDTVTVVVQDTTPPSATAQNVTIYLDGSGTASIVAANINNGSADNCGSVTLAIDSSNFDCSEVGANTVKLYVTDANSNVDSTTATVTVLDTLNPTAVAQNVTVYLDGSGTASITAADINNSSADNCTSVTLAASSTAFTCSNIGTNNVTLTVTDGQGNTSTAVAVVTVADTTVLAVTITNGDTVSFCQGDSVLLLANSTAGNFSWTNLDSFQFNLVGVVGISAANIDYHNLAMDNSGTPYVAYSDEANGGNTTVKKYDGTVWQNVGAAGFSAGSAWFQNITVDNNGTPYVAYLDNANGFKCTVMKFDGTTWLNVGTAGFSAGTVYSVSVVIDNNGTPYVAYADAARSYKATVMKFDGAVWQNVGPIGFTPGQADQPSLSIDNSGTPYIAYRDIDNSSEATVMKFNGTAWQNVGLIGFSAGHADSPSIDIDNNGTPYVGFKDLANGGRTTVMKFDGTAWQNEGMTGFSSDQVYDVNIALDNSGTPYVSYQEQNNGSKANVMKFNGTTWQNVLTAGAFSVGSAGKPSLALDNNGTPYIAYLDGTDSNRITVMNLRAPEVSSTSTYEVKTQGRYIVSSSGTCNTFASDTISVLLNTDPPIAITQNITVNLDALGNATIVAADVNNGSSDNCGPVTLAIDVSTFTCTEIGANNVILTVTDANSNTSTATAVVTVADIASPTAIAQNITINLDASGNATIVAADVDNGSIDNCTSITLEASPTAFTCSNVGTNNVTLTVTDGQGNISTATAIVTILDTISPIAIAQNLTVYLGPLGVANITATEVNNVSIDNCGISMMSLDVTSFSCTEVGVNTVILRVSDSSTNTSTATAIVTVVDTMKPIVITKNHTLYLDGFGVDTLLVSDIDNGSSDSCGIASRALSKQYFNCSNLGVDTVTLIVTDVNGNIDSATAIITIVDIWRVSAFAQDITVYLDISGQVTIDSLAIDGGSSDNCSIERASVSQSNFSCADIGGNTVEMLLIDPSGNRDSAVAIVTVLDTISPLALVQNITVYLDTSGNVSIVASDIDNGSTDNCSSVNISIDTTSFNCSDLGTNNVILTVTDGSGNISFATAAVTVADTTSPTVAAQNITVYLDTSGNVSIVATDIDNGSGDNCSTVTLVIDTAAFDCSDLGTNNVTLTVTDGSSNTSTATAVVTVVDTTSPVAIVQNITVYLDTSGNASVVAADLDNGSGDNCSTVTLTIVTAAFDCSDLGTNNVILMVTDGSSNTSTATAVVTIVDTTAPAAIVKNITVYLNGSGTASITAADVDNGSADNCSTVTLSLDTSSFDCTDQGINNVILTATDGSGNTSIANTTVTVSDTTSPIAIAQNISLTLDGTGNAIITAADVDNGSTDNCSTVNLSIDSSNFDCNDIGANVVALTVTDGSGNTSTRIVTVTVGDTIIRASIDTQVACDSYTWIDGVTYTASNNSATFTETNVAGCDSVITLDLTINNTLRDTTAITACDSYLWSANSQMYMLSGIYSDTTQVNGCDSITSIDLMIDSSIISNAGSDETRCEIEVAVLSANTSTNVIGDWTVLFGSGNFVDPSNGNTSVSGMSQGPNQFIWSITNGVCPISADTVTITKANNPIVDAGVDQTIFKDDRAVLLVTSDFDGQVGVSYSWEPAFILVSSNVRTAETNSFLETTTEFSVDVTSPDGCIGRDSLLVAVNQTVTFSSGFTPNGDGTNDLWQIKNIQDSDILSHQVTIYDSFGSQLFNTNDFQGWDGTFSGSLLPVSSYYYTVKLNFINGESRVETGIVTLLR